jgi:hypothetical protein
LHSEAVKDALVVNENNALNEGLPLDDKEASPDDEILGLAEPEPDTEEELEIVFLGVHDGE